MGVSTNCYMVYGIKIDFDTEFLDYCDEHDLYNSDKLDVIVDGMSGEYIIVGKVLFDSGDVRYGFEGGDSFKSIDISLLANYEKTCREKFNESFHEFIHLIEDKKFELFGFTHYS